MTTVRVQRAIHGPFIVHLCTLGPGGRIERPMIEARKRSEHTNAFAVSSGLVECVGPEVSWTMRSGQADDELPDYPSGGKYTFIAGPDGSTFFCIGRFPPGVPFIRDRVNLKAGDVLEVARGSLAAVYGGKVTLMALMVDGMIVDADKPRSTPAPCIVDATGTKKIVRCDADAKVLMMRLG